MQVKFKYGTREQLEKVRKVKPWINEAEVYFDSEDGSLYVVSLNKKNELKTSFENYIQAQLFEIEKSI